MKTRRGFDRQLTLILLVVAIAACPLTITSFAYRPAAIASGLAQPPIQFTPDVKDLELTSIAATAFSTGIATADAMATPTPGPPIATVSGDTITIGDETYPIGDTFTDASQIPIGSTEDSTFGHQGYSTILAVGAQDYRLIWVTDKGEKKYMIVREDDPLFSGPDGFTTQLEKVRDAEEATLNAIKAEYAGLGAVIAGLLAVCPLTGGGGCIGAIVTGFLATLGGAALGLWHIVTDLIPATVDVNNAFVQIDINQP